MAFDFSTLVTDRTMADVLARNDKGTYNAADLNRVDDCLEDLVARLRRMGYSVPGYQRVKIPRETKPSSRLPEGYTEVQYIQSTGAQYVDTGFKPKQNSRITVDMDVLSYSGQSALFGSRNSGGASGFAIFTYDSNNGYQNDYASQQSYPVGGISSGRHTIDKDKNLLIVDGTTIDTNTVSAFSGNYTAFVLQVNNGGAIISACPTSASLYSCQIYDNGTLVRDYIPCISPAGAVGLYDLVDGKFYGNSGTGVFFAGPRKVTLPEGYTQVEHIQSSGAQYINTDFTPTSVTRVLMQVKVTNLTDTTALMGTRNSASGTDSKSYTLLIVNKQPRSDFFGGSKLNSAYIPTDKIDIDRNGRNCKVGNLTITNDAKTASAARPLYLFACNTAGTATLSASMLLWSCQIEEGGIVKRDYIPCTNANGAAGLYDLVGQEFYGNAGTGSFTAGEAVTWPEEPDTPSDDLDPYTWYESDVPTASHMAQYRGNVAAVRAVLTLPDGTPEPPGTMEQLTTAGANNIETVLLAVDLILNHIPAAVRHCGVTVCGSKGVIA